MFCCYVNYSWLKPCEMSQNFDNKSRSSALETCKRVARDISKHFSAHNTDLIPLCAGLIPLPSLSVVWLVNPCVCALWLVNLSQRVQCICNLPPQHWEFQTDICAVIPGRSRCDGGWTALGRPWGRLIPGNKNTTRSLRRKPFNPASLNLPVVEEESV